jgi:hypothetical protein
LNACYVERLGYGVAADELAAPALGHFLANAETFAANIHAHPQHDRNVKLFATLDGLFP